MGKYYYGSGSHIFSINSRPSIKTSLLFPVNYTYFLVLAIYAAKSSY